MPDLMAGRREFGSERDEEEPNSKLSGRRNHQGYRYQWWHLIILLVVAFPYIAICVLFGLYGSIKKNSTNNVSTRMVDTFMSSITPV
jgi:hypothetical protein